MRVEHLSANDYEEAMDFINMVFSLAHGSFDFAHNLPRLYQPTEECMSKNLVVRESGKIRALVGLYPDTMHVGGTALKLGGIGAVSSHPGDRGKGWMKTLMALRVEEMRREGYDLSFLGGQRQRYQYFGFEKAGILLEHKVNRSNLKHLHESLPQFQFEPMQASDLQWIQKAKELHDAAPIHCVRPLEQFHMFLVTYCMQPWAALRADGSMAGYLVSSPGHDRIVEIFAEDDAVTGIVKSWFAQHGVKDASIILPAFAQKAARSLGGIAEDVNILNNANWQIFNWEKVIGALMNVKNEQNSLAEGSLSIGIQGYGNLKISVGGKKATCESTSKQAHVVWEPLLAARILFGHIPLSYVIAVSESIEPLIVSWFPLPLGWLPGNYV